MPNVFPGLNDPIFTAWLESLWRASWQGGLALLLAWGVTRAWAWMPPGVRVWLWRLALVKLLAAFLWTGAVPLRVVPEGAAVVLAPPAWWQPLPKAGPLAGTAARSAARPVAAPPAPVTPALGPRAEWLRPVRPALPFLGLLWACCVLLGALRLFLAGRLARRLRRACRAVEDAAVLALFRDCVDRAGFRRAPALLARLTGTPLLLGLAKPAIIVPEALLADDTHETLRLVLFHELAHLKRRDLLWSWLPALCHMLFFFHPLVWLAAREHRLAQEIACDALALRLADAGQAEYARMLTASILQRRTPRPAPLALGIAESFATIHRRLSAMTHFTPRLARAHVALSAVLLVPLLLALVPWRLAAQEENRPKMLLQVGHGQVVTALTITPDGRTLVSASGPDIVHWDLMTGLMKDRYHPVGEPTFVYKLDRAGRYLAAMRFHEPSAEIHDLHAGKLVHALPEGLQAVVDFSRRGPWYWTREYSGLNLDVRKRYALTQRNLADGTARRTIPDLFGLMLAISPDETRAITQTGRIIHERGRLPSLEDAAFILWDMATGTEVRRLTGFASISPAAVFSPDGRLFAASPRGDGEGFDVSVWEVATGKRVALLSGHTEKVAAIAFSPDGRWLASDGFDKRAILWDTGAWQRAKTFEHEMDSVGTLAFTPDGRFLATSNANKPIQVWDIATGEVAHTLAGKAAVRQQTNLALSPDGRWLAMGAEERIGLWDLAEGRLARELPIPVETARPFALAFSPDGSVFAAGLANDHGEEGRGHLLVWRTADGTLLHDLPAHTSIIGQIAFSPDGASAATGAMDSMVILWNTKDWTPARRITAAGRVAHAAFSPDGARLFWTAHLGGAALLQWLDIATGAFGESAVEEDFVYTDLHVSPDGSLLLLQARRPDPDKPDMSLYKRLLLDAQTGRTLREMAPVTWNDGATPFLTPLGFSPDGRRVLGIGTFHTDLIQWDADTGKVVRTTRLPARIDLLSGTPDGTRLATLNAQEGTVQLWDVGQLLAAEAPAELATLRWFDKGRWLITTPRGHFDCAPELEQAIAWKQDGKMFPFDKFAGEYRRPERVKAALERQ
jgi:WD40 repeat protein/Zn-dependent protease with chaperone function